MSKNLINNKKLAVIGCSGLVGSSILRCALEKGYEVNGTMRNIEDSTKINYLKKLKNFEKLNLFKAEMSNENDFNFCLQDISTLFIACLVPTYKGFDGTLAKELDDKRGYNEIINPTVNGCINILKSAKKLDVKNVVICSSTSSTNPIPPVPIKNEIDHWSDEIEQCKSKKYTSATKTIMEKAAIKFCNDNNIRLSIILPTGLYGDAVLPDHMKHNPFVWLKRVLEGGEPRHLKVPNDSASMIHLRDLAELFLACHENKKASGRYYGVYKSLHWQDIYNECQKLIPDMKMPKPFNGNAVEPTGFDFSRRDSLGVKIRDFPTILRDTIEWIKSNPFDDL